MEAIELQPRLPEVCHGYDDTYSHGSNDHLGRVARQGPSRRSFSKTPPRLEHAERALQLAFDMASSRLEGDLYRRRALLRLCQGRQREALEDARRALDLSSGQDRARAYKALGIIYYYANDHSEAMAYLGHAVATLDPSVEHSFISAMICFTGALSAGTREDVQKGLGICHHARARLRDRHKMQRAKLWWIEGLLYNRLGEKRKAWRALDNARRDALTVF